MTNNTPNIGNTCILTFPRSGSNLLENTLEAMSHFHLHKIHKVWQVYDRNIITIVRDPYDTLVSHIAMIMHFHPDKSFFWEKEVDAVKKFCDVYEYLINKANIIFDYNDLIKDPKAIAKIVSGYVNEPIVFEDPIIFSRSSDPGKEYLVSSKVSEHYEKAKDFIDKQDLSRCYELYNEAISLKTGLVP